MSDDTTREEKRLIKAFGEDNVNFTGHSFAVRFLDKMWKVPFGQVTLLGIAAIKKAMRESATELTMLPAEPRTKTVAPRSSYQERNLRNARRGWESGHR